MDPNLIKGHFFLGQALIEVENYDDAAKHLQRGNWSTSKGFFSSILNFYHLLWSAQDLAKDQKLNFGDEIAYQLRLARKRRWNLMEDTRMQEEIELQTYLNGLIQKDRDSQISRLQDEHIDEQSLKESEEAIQLKANKSTSDLDAMFATLDVRRKVRTGLLYNKLSLTTLATWLQLTLRLDYRNAMFPTTSAERSASKLCEIPSLLQAA